jgi:outer membrane biosynthesis protein TonB
VPRLLFTAAVTAFCAAVMAAPGCGKQERGADPAADPAGTAKPAEPLAQPAPPADPPAKAEPPVLAAPADPSEPPPAPAAPEPAEPIKPAPPAPPAPADPAAKSAAPTTADECTAAGGTVAPSIGGQPHCPGGKKSIGAIRLGIEGALCCK